MARPNKNKPNTQTPTTANTNANGPALDFITPDMIAEVKKNFENDDTILFSLSIRPGLNTPPFITLHSLNMRWNEAGEPWIAFPSMKGKDGKYYRYMYAVFTSDTITAIEALLTT